MLPASTVPLDSDSLAGFLQVSISPPSEAIDVEERLSASGVIIADVAGGQSLYRKQADVRRPMASLTKLMTALLIVEHHTMDEWVTVPVATGRVEGNKIYLPPGEQFTVGNLLSALLIASANDAAEVLAIYHSGSVSAFVEEMNARAGALGLKDTQYANPSGLDSSLQWSTPQDLTWLASFVLRKPEIRERMGKRGTRIISRQGSTIPLTHTHALLGTESEVVAGKTGTTMGAKECLLSVVDAGGHEYVVVLLHSLERYKDMLKILSAIEQRASETATALL